MSFQTTTQTPNRTLEDWTAALPGLKRRGVEHCGPCPLCGGNDRFHIRPGRNGGDPLIGCRGCMDGQPETVRRQRYGELRRAVFQETPQNRHRMPWERVSTRPSTHGNPQSSTASLARAIEAASERATVGSPAGQYLVKRWVWPPPGEGLPRTLPPGVRWLNRAAGFELDKLRGFPKAAAGVLVFCYRLPAGELAAVSLEALTQDGTRTAPRWRKTYGPRTGAAFEAAKGGGVVLAEGEVTALAGRWLHPGCRVLACGGTSGLEAAARQVQGRLVLEVDGDKAGRAVVARIQAARPLGEVDAAFSPAGQDAADTLTAALEQTGGRPGV